MIYRKMSATRSKGADELKKVLERVSAQRKVAQDRLTEEIKEINESSSRMYEIETEKN